MAWPNAVLQAALDADCLLFQIFWANVAIAALCAWVHWFGKMDWSELPTCLRAQQDREPNGWLPEY